MVKRDPPEVAWARHLDRMIGAVLDTVPGNDDIRSLRALGPCSADREGPSWMRIAFWLDAIWAAGDPGREPGGALADVLWGQYALFLSLRVKDDVLDGRRGDLRLLLVADRFLVESLRSFRRVRELGDAFWQSYLDCVQGTLDGAAEVGRLEAEPGAFRAEHLGLHARVAGMAKVGVAAVCHIHHKEAELAWLSHFQDHLAVANQIEDDLRDLADDLRVGRYTWVGNTLLALRPGEVLSPDERASRLGQGLLRPERSAAIAGLLRRTLRAASAVVPASAPHHFSDLVQRLAAAPAEIERSLHETRVRWIFGQDLDAASPPSRPTNSPSSTSKA